MASGGMHIPYPTPLDSPLAISYRNHQKNLAYFSHLAPLELFFFTKRQSQKGGGAWHNGLAPKYAPVDRIWTMRGPRLFDHTDWKSKKGLHVLRCPVFTKNIGIMKSKKKVAYTRQMFCFPMKVSVKRTKKVLIVRDEAPIFYDALGFSLLSLYVNPALCLLPIFSLSTCDISNLCGLQTHGSCF